MSVLIHIRFILIKFYIFEILRNFMMRKSRKNKTFYGAYFAPTGKRYLCDLRGGALYSNN